MLLTAAEPLELATTVTLAEPTDAPCLAGRIQLEESPQPTQEVIRETVRSATPGHAFDPELLLTSERLDLRSNALGPSDARAMAPALIAGSSLTTLDLSSNNLTNLGTDMSGVSQLASAIAACGSLTECSLRGNRLGDEGWALLFRALCSHPSNRIAAWDLSGENLGAEIATSLAEYLSASRSLTRLDLSSNSIVSRSSGWTCDVRGRGCLSGGARRWSCLCGCNWDACDVCHQRGYWHRHELHLLNSLAGIERLVDGLRHNCGSLTNLSLLGNNLDDEAASRLLEIRRERPTLRTLCGLAPGQIEASFVHKGLGPADARLLAPEVAVHASLTALDLRGNAIGPLGAKALAPALASASLLRLNVRLNLLNAISKEQLRASAPGREGFELLL